MLLSSRWRGLVEPNPFPEQDGFADALARLGPAQPKPVTNISWFAACLPGAGTSVWIADSSQRLPPLPLQLSDEYFPFSHYFNCPRLRKTAPDWLWAAGTCYARLPQPGVPVAGAMGDSEVGPPPLRHAWGPLCQGCARAWGTLGSGFSAAPTAGCTRRAWHTGGRWCVDAGCGSGAAECGVTGLQRGLSRSAGFLERLEPAPAPAASREVLPAPGRGPKPRGSLAVSWGGHSLRCWPQLHAPCHHCAPFWGDMVLGKGQPLHF